MPSNLLWCGVRQCNPLSNDWEWYERNIPDSRHILRRVRFAIETMWPYTLMWFMIAFSFVKNLYAVLLFPSLAYASMHLLSLSLSPSLLPFTEK